MIRPPTTSLYEYHVDLGDRDHAYLDTGGLVLLRVSVEGHRAMAPFASLVTLGLRFQVAAAICSLLFFNLQEQYRVLFQSSYMSSLPSTANILVIASSGQSWPSLFMVIGLVMPQHQSSSNAPTSLSCPCDDQMKRTFLHCFSIFMLLSCGSEKHREGHPGLCMTKTRIPKLSARATSTTRPVASAGSLTAIHINKGHHA